MLIALLRFGLPDNDAIGFGWWVEAELAKLKRQAIRIDRRDVGKLIEMTTDELVEHELWHLGPPADQTAEEYKAWKKERDKRLAAERQQAKRDKEKERKRAKQAAKERKLAKAKAEVHPRHTAIMTMLADGGLSVADMMVRVRKSKRFGNQMIDAAHAFRRPSARAIWVNGPPENAISRNLRNAIHRAVNQLEAKGVIKSSVRAGRRGPERWVWLVEQAETGSVGASVASVSASHPLLGTKPNDFSGFGENDPRHAVGKHQRRDCVFPTPLEQAERPKDVAGIQVMDAEHPESLQAFL